MAKKEDEKNGAGPTYVVILAEPKNEGNVGAVARAMENFGLDELVLVNPCAIGSEAEKRAMHAQDTLLNARRVATFGEASDLVDLTVGTTGIKSDNEKQFIRLPLAPAEAAERLARFDGRVGLVFGREDFGLYNEELAVCDMLVTIPTDERYPVMNISHAVTVVLYEFIGRRGGHRAATAATSFEKEKLHEYFGKLLDDIEYPEHKKDKTRVMFRRLIGRAAPSKWEFHTTMGVFSMALKAARGERGGALKKPKTPARRNAARKAPSKSPRKRKRARSGGK